MKRSDRQQGGYSGEDGTYLCLLDHHRPCYLCATVKFDCSEKTNLEEHHIFGGVPNRRLSEKYGLKVYLCPEHHRTSNEAVHRPDRNWYQRSLQITGQKYFETYYPHLDFVKIFGKNYYAEE